MVTILLRIYTRRLLFIVWLATLAVDARAAGVKTFVIPADSRGPQISAQLWTPCALPPGPIRVTRGTIQLTIRGLKDCHQSAKKLPLVVISHGMLEDLFSHYDTAEFLADSGFAVVSFNHTLDSASATQAQMRKRE